MGPCLGDTLEPCKKWRWLFLLAGSLSAESCERCRNVHPLNPASCILPLSSRPRATVYLPLSDADPFTQPRTLAPCPQIPWSTLWLQASHPSPFQFLMQQDFRSLALQVRMRSLIWPC